MTTEPCKECWHSNCCCDCNTCEMQRDNLELGLVAECTCWQCEYSRKRDRENGLEPDNGRASRRAITNVQQLARVE